MAIDTKKIKQKIMNQKFPPISDKDMKFLQDQFGKKSPGKKRTGPADRHPPSKKKTLRNKLKRKSPGVAGKKKKR